jgi:uncharacterized protein YjbJ (UPF0337 family)
MGGQTDVMKGRLKEAGGALTGNNDEFPAEGQTDQAIGKGKGVAEKAADKVVQALSNPSDERRWHMTPHSGLYVALIGLVMAVLGIATLFLLREWQPDGGDRLTIVYYTFTIAVDLAAMLGLIVMVLGLFMAGALAITKHVGQSS